MPSTAIGLSFDLHDLSANYEVVGSSDNYSFQYNLGQGKDLVTGEHEEYDLIAFGQNEFTGERIQTIVPLKGNYGDFNIRVFAVSDIGTRSEFVQEQIYISPPTFDGTFTFANLKIDDLPDGANLNNLIINSPDNVGDTLEVESEYVNKNISLSWDLIPPEGHSLGGQEVNEELNSDAFFDHFEIKIKNTKDNILIDDATLNNSVSLQDSLSTANVAGKLNSYKSFNLQISEAAFSDQELDLDRHVFFEISAFDSKGGSCTGTLSGVNFLPDLSLSQRTSSSTSSFSFSSEDSDFKSVEVNYIGIPTNESLNDIYNLQNNIDFFKNIRDASQYVSLKDEQFYQDQSMVVFEGDVYIAQQDHLNSNLTSPPNSVYWLNIGPKVEYVSGSLQITEESFVNKQIFGYSYYYTFRPSDGYGTGQLFNFTEDGLVEASNFGELSPITSEIKIGDLDFREREDDLIFEWNFVDQDGFPVELANEKYQINFGDEPKVLGLSGHLFDNNTNRYLSGIGEEKLNSEFTYSRELNNSIYKDGGFPEGIENFNSSEIYTPDDNDKVIDKTDIFNQSQYFTDGASEFFSTLPVEKEFVYNSIKQNADKQPYVRPFYEYWDPAKTYYYRSSLPFSDVVKYNGVLYESLSDSGPESSEEIGVFNENAVYNLNDLVVAPARIIEIFNSTKSYLSTDVVLYEGAIYEALTHQSVGNAVEPDLDSSFWKIIRPFYDIDCFIYKYVASSSASTLAPTRDDTQSWQLQTPDVSDKFKICIDSYSNTPNADYVFFNETVYKANNNSTTSEPPIPLTTLNQDYTTLDWTPFWEINDDLEDVVFGHIGIPESGKRSVGLEVGIVSSDGQVVSREKIIGDNPAPVISSDGFSIDSQSEVTKVKFNFNYLRGRQEKTTLLNLYRSDQPNFEITGADGLPFTGIDQDGSTFIKSVLGEGDATFGDNITQIVDDTAEVGEEITGYYYKLLPFDDFGSGVLYTAVDDEDPIEKVWVLPKNFHDQRRNAPPGPAIKITTDEIPGPVGNLNGSTAFQNYFLNWNMPTAQIQEGVFVDDVPNDISYYEVWQSTGQSNNFLKFENGSFLTEAQNATGYRRIDGVEYTFGDNIPTEYEDFANKIENATNILDIDARSRSIQITHSGQVNDTSYFWVRPVDHAGNKGPFTGASDLANTDNVEGLKLILGQANTTDIADFEQNISQSFPNTISLIPQNPFSYDASTNTTSWINHILYYDGVGYIVEGGSAVDQKYIYWSSSRDGVKYGNVNDSSNTEYSRNQALKTALGLEEPGGGAQTNSDNLRNVQKAGVYNSSDYHPAGAGDSTEATKGGDPYNDEKNAPLLLPEGDFIIARIAGGTVTTMWHSFANATIGTAHIEEAAITSAKVHTLTADKIRSAEIRGQDIQVGGTGQIRSFDFPGLVNPIQNQPQGFAVSGDGTFIFAADDGRLHFDDGELVLEGKLRQIDGKEYTFLDLDASPDSFFYDELIDGTYAMDDHTDVCNIRASFQNSFVQSTGVRFRISDTSGNNFVEYTDHDSNGEYNISGFRYDPSNDFVPGEPSVASAKFDITGFDKMIHTSNPPLSTVIVSVSGDIVSYERSIPINLVADGAPGPTGRSPIYRGLWSDQKDYTGVLEGTNGFDDLRGDVVFLSGEYYIAKNNSGPGTSVGAKNPGISVNENFWAEFGAQFESVATTLLLAEDAIITHNLVIGEEDPNNPGAGAGGVIKTAGKEFENGIPGFFLSNTGVPPNPQFDVGGTGSFIRFDSDSDRIEIKGSLIINSRDYTDLDINSTDGEDAIFIGGGYNNIITGSQAGQNGLASSIVGGGENDISGRFSFIGGGFNNNLGDNFSAIVAGYNNEMPNLETGNAGANFIGAGVLNVIDGGSSQSVCNGKFNEIIYSPELYLGEIVPEDQTNVVFNDNMDLLGEKYLAFDPKDGVYPMEDFIIGDSSLSSAVPSVKLMTLAYRSLLYREPDSGGMNSYLGFSDMGSVISDIKTAPEYSNRQNNLPAPKLQMILADSSKSFAGISDIVCIIGSRIAEKFHVARDFLSGTRSIALGNWGILENPFYTGDDDLACFFASNSKYYDSSSEFGYWVYAVGTAINGWVYISASYNSEGIWIYNTSYGWIFIFNSETFNLSFGAYQRFDNGENYRLSDGSVIP